MHDTGQVVRFGRKYSATWALAGTAAALPHDAFGALEAAWHARRTPTLGGEAEGHRAFLPVQSVAASKIFGGKKNRKIFRRTLSAGIDIPTISGAGLSVDQRLLSTPLSTIGVFPHKRDSS